MQEEVTLGIVRFWDGRPLPPDALAQLELGLELGSLVVQVDAPYFGDPPPPGPAGSTPGLLNYEVVELFIAGPDEHYLEVELGPHGHYWVLELDGSRQPIREGIRIGYRVVRDKGRFHGVARLPLDLLPRGPWTVNAYAIHEKSCAGGSERCHHAHAPVPGDRPDFHQLDRFVPVLAERELCFV